MISTRSQGKGHRITRRLPSDRSVTNKWLQELLDDVETNYKYKLDKMMKLHPEAGDEVLKGHPHICAPDIDPADLGLHPPVAALMNLILKDPGMELYRVIIDES